jgi:hypothetical protein
MATIAATGMMLGLLLVTFGAAALRRRYGTRVRGVRMAG